MGYKIKKRKVAPQLLKLDLGCGQNKAEGFTGVDKASLDTVDIVHDLFVFPWPFKDGSVEEVHSSHFFEHVPGNLRGKFMDELYRIMIWEARARFIVPYWSSKRSVQDFTHEWPPICEDSFLYFNKNFRDTNKLTHGCYDLKCDFDFSWGYVIGNELGMRSEEYRQHVIQHEVNTVSDLDVTLRKAKREEPKK